MLKLAVEVQDAGDECLWGSYRAKFRSEVRAEGLLHTEGSLFTLFRLISTHVGGKLVRVYINAFHCASV